MLADIGGTNARFAWQSGPGAPLQHVQVLQCHEHVGFEQAAQIWLTEHQLPSPERAALAVACAHAALQGRDHVADEDLAYACRTVLAPRARQWPAEASAAPEREGALANLLNIIGRRNGARSLITLG